MKAAEQLLPVGAVEHFAVQGGSTFGVCGQHS